MFCLLYAVRIKHSVFSTFCILSQYVNELKGFAWFMANAPPGSFAKNVHRTFSRRFGPVENIGVEPMASCVQGRRSSQLS